MSRTKRRPEAAVRRFLPVLPPLDLDLASRIALRGAERAVELRNAPTALEVELSMARSSVLTLTVEDPDYELLRDRNLLAVIDLDLAPDGDTPSERQERIDMRYVRRWRMDRRRAVGGIGTSGTSTTIRFWSLADAALKSRSAPMRKPAGKMDLRGFVSLLAREVEDDLRLVPVVPRPGVAPPREETSSGSSRGGSSSSGFGEAAAKKVKIKGRTADREQLRVIDEALSVTAEKRAPARVAIAVVAALIVESTARNLKRGDRDSIGALQVRVGLHGRDVASSVRRSVEMFLDKGFTGAGGAIKLAKDHPTQSPAWIAQKVQGSAYPTRYAQYSGEARAAVEAWSGKPMDQWHTVTGSSRGGSESRPSEWRRGTAEGAESSWTALGRYAEQLGRRRFTSANRLVVARDQDLILAQPHLSVPITDDMFVERPSIDQDDGARVTSVDFQVLAEAWSAPPGAVVDLTRAGPADGAWLVETIRARAGDPVIDVSLTQPQTQAPERGASAASSRTSKPRSGQRPAGKSGRYTYPLAKRGKNLGGVAAHKARAWGNWQSDNAVDIGVPRGTAVFAVAAGTITKLSGSWRGGSGNPDGFHITMRTGDNEWFYTHLRYRSPTLRVGGRVTAGQYLGGSGAANGVDHLHIACRSGDPARLLGV